MYLEVDPYPQVSFKLKANHHILNLMFSGKLEVIILKREHPRLRLISSTTQEDTDDRSGAYYKHSFPHVLSILEHSVTQEFLNNNNSKQVFIKCLLVLKKQHGD